MKPVRSAPISPISSTSRNNLENTKQSSNDSSNNNNNIYIDKFDNLNLQQKYELLRIKDLINKIIKDYGNYQGAVTLCTFALVNSPETSLFNKINDISEDNNLKNLRLFLHELFKVDPVIKQITQPFFKNEFYNNDKLTDFLIEKVLTTKFFSRDLEKYANDENIYKNYRDIINSSSKFIYTLSYNLEEFEKNEQRRQRLTDARHSGFCIIA